jgi:N-acetylmuramoyl-L-alanine amidase
VDPGHGGHDPGAGAVGYSSVPEKTIVLDISKNLAKNLSAAGAKVVMTRTNDTFIELDDRAATAEKYNAGLLVSIHADSCPKAHIAGPTVYIARSATRQSRRVAQNVVNAFNNAGIKSRGIREADFRVLVKHSKPSILVECGYLTNRTEASRLCSTSYRKKVAQIIAQGIINSF